MAKIENVDDIIFKKHLDHNYKHTPLTKRILKDYAEEIAYKDKMNEFIDSDECYSQVNALFSLSRNKLESISKDILHSFIRFCDYSDFFLGNRNIRFQLENIMSRKDNEVFNDGFKKDSIVYLKSFLLNKPHLAFIFRTELSYFSQLLDNQTKFLFLSNSRVQLKMNELGLPKENKLESYKTILKQIEINHLDYFFRKTFVFWRIQSNLSTRGIIKSLNDVLMEKFHYSFNNSYTYSDGLLKINSEKRVFKVGQLAFKIFEVLYANKGKKTFKKEELLEMDGIKNLSEVVKNPKIKIQTIFKNGDALSLRKNNFDHTGMYWFYKK